MKTTITILKSRYLTVALLVTILVLLDIIYPSK